MKLSKSLWALMKCLKQFDEMENLKSKVEENIAEILKVKIVEKNDEVQRKASSHFTKVHEFDAASFKIFVAFKCKYVCQDNSIRALEKQLGLQQLHGKSRGTILHQAI